MATRRRASSAQAAAPRKETKRFGNNPLASSSAFDLTRSGQRADGDQRVDALVLVERHCTIGTAVLVDCAVGEAVVAPLYTAEDALDVADESVDVILASRDLEI
eukprot:8744090-Pyramimonas_sp.AAC.1